MKKVFAVTAVLLLLGLLLNGQAAASDMVVNLTANQYGELNLGHQTYPLTLASGTWEFALVCPQTDPRAAYWGWQAWTNSGPWCTATCIYVAGVRNIIGFHSSYSDPQQAFWASVANGQGRFTTTLTAPTTIHMGVSDSVIADNTGGVSVLIRTVPEPSSFLPLVSGLAGLCGLVLRRRR